MSDVIADLNTEVDVFTRLVEPLDDVQLALPTAAPGWTIGHQIAHLIAYYRLVGLSAEDPNAFTALTARLHRDYDAYVRGALSGYLLEPPGALLVRWQQEHRKAVDALAAAAKTDELPWLDGPVRPSVLAADALTELFAHGQDIADALEVRPERTDTIGHVAWFGVHRRDRGYRVRELTPPADPFRFELIAPSGTLWEFGPVDAAQRISGPAEDFCLLVTRRRHRDDLKLATTGEEADHWLDIAQAYHGPAGGGRVAGQFDRLG
jgi:uncharacterized protein (TIGR03084 family)